MLSLKKKRLNTYSMRKYNFTLFPCFCFRLLLLYGLYFWILFQFWGFNFVFFVCVFPLENASPLHLNPTTGEHFKTPLKISSQISNRQGKKLSPLTWNLSNQIFLQGLFWFPAVYFDFLPPPTSNAGYSR